MITPGRLTWTPAITNCTVVILLHFKESIHFCWLSNANYTLWYYFSLCKFNQAVIAFCLLVLPMHVNYISLLSYSLGGTITVKYYHSTRLQNPEDSTLKYFRFCNSDPCCCSSWSVAKKEHVCRRESFLPSSKPTEQFNEVPPLVT
jgi:hypothetical protein